MKKSEIESALYGIRKQVILDCTNTNLLQDVRTWRPWLNSISKQLLPLEEAYRLLRLSRVEDGVKELKAQSAEIKKMMDALEKQFIAKVRKLEAEEGPEPQRHLTAIDGGKIHSK